MRPTRLLRDKMWRARSKGSPDVSGYYTWSPVVGPLFVAAVLLFVGAMMLIRTTRRKRAAADAAAAAAAEKTKQSATLTLTSLGQLLEPLTEPKHL